LSLTSKDRETLLYAIGMAIEITSETVERCADEFIRRPYSDLAMIITEREKLLADLCELRGKLTGSESRSRG